MEGFADGQAVEGEVWKQAVMEEGAVGAPAPWFLLTSGGLLKKLAFHAWDCVCP